MLIDVEWSYDRKLGAKQLLKCLYIERLFRVIHRVGKIEVIFTPLEIPLQCYRVLFFFTPDSIHPLIAA